MKEGLPQVLIAIVLSFCLCFCSVVASRMYSYAKGQMLLFCVAVGLLVGIIGALLGELIKKKKK